MNYITAQTIKELREKRHLTQAQLAAALDVSDKTISKWETGRGLPDITLLEPLAKTLGVSLAELLSGDVAVNRNIAGNMNHLCFYVCPVCGNIATSLGEVAISCHGIKLPPLEKETPDTAHSFVVEKNDEGYYAHASHPMTKTHHFSFIAFISTDALQMRKLYPEQIAEARFAITGSGTLYAFCNHHGLFAQKV